MNEEESASANSSEGNRVGVQAAIDHMLLRKVDALLWLTRLGTMIFTILCIFPFGMNPYICYQRALMSNAATSALRLHQRLPNVQFTREFMALLLTEDSCHYLLYSLLFIYSYPVTLALLPIFLFALLHSVNYSVIILNKLGHNNSRFTRMLMSLVELHHQNILKLVAFTEVCLLPVTVYLTFSGKGSIITPCAYYRFLTFRYASRRNPYTRTVFHELRLTIENFSNTPGRSQGLKNLCQKIIFLVSWLAPPVPHHQ